MASDQSLKIHQIIPHILELGLEHVTQLIQGIQGSYVFGIFARNGHDLPHFLFELVLLSFAIGYLREMVQVSIQKEVLELKYIESRLISDEFYGGALFCLADQVDWSASEKDAYFGQAEPQFSWEFVPFNQFIEKV